MAWIAAVVLAFAALLWLLSHGTLQVGFVRGFISSAPATSSRRTLPREDLATLVGAVVDGGIIDGFSFSPNERDRPGYSLTQEGAGLELGGSFLVASQQSEIGEFMAVMGGLGYLPFEDSVWNEGMGPERESRSINYELPMDFDVALAACSRLIEATFPPDGPLYVDGWHSNDWPDSGAGISWRKRVDRLGEVLSPAEES